MIRTKAFDLKDYRSDNKLIIYGASVYGEIARKILEQYGIIPDYYCDKSEKKDYYLSVPVVQPSQLHSLGKIDIIIASADFFFEIRDMLEKLQQYNLYDMSKLLCEDVDTTVFSNRALEVFNSKDYYINLVSYQKENSVVFNRIQYVVTEKCTLRCKDCSHLIPYYKNPKDVDLEKNKDDFDKLINCVDFIGELRILGGEPFVNKNVYKLIEWYKDNERIRSITIYTNGTIIPSEKNLSAMRNAKVKVHISNYGINEKKINELVDTLEKYQIKYFVRAYDEWQDAGGVENRGYTRDQMKKHFATCFERNGYTFLNGRLYRCPRAAHGVNLEAMPNSKENYVDITGWHEVGELQRRELIRLQNLDYLEACRYCSGPDNHQKGIPAAVQINKCIEYDRINME